MFVHQLEYFLLTKKGEQRSARQAEKSCTRDRASLKFRFSSLMNEVSFVIHELFAKFDRLVELVIFQTQVQKVRIECLNVLQFCRRTMPTVSDYPSHLDCDQHT